MKSILYSFIFFGLCFCVKGTFFKFGDKTNKTCILLNLDGSFNLTYRTANESQKTALFDLNGAGIVQSSSECGGATFNSILMVELFPSGEQLKFTFSKHADDTIKMNVDLYVEPARHFDDQNETSPFEMKTYSDLLVGYVSKSNYSYRCFSTEKMYFNNDAPFYMSMNISNLWVQAFNITDDTYGPVLECGQDKHTTSSILTTEPTTEPPSNVTTEPLPETTTEPEPKTVTTTVPETTSEIHTVITTEPSSEPTSKQHTTLSTQPTSRVPPPGIPRYTVKEGNKYCIVLAGNIVFTTRYNRQDGSMGSAKVGLPSDFAVNGSCRFNNSDSTQQLRISFFKSTWHLIITISKEGNSKRIQYLNNLAADSGYSWQRLELNYIIDNHFPQAKEAGGKKDAVTENAFGTYKVDGTGSFKCKAKQDIDIGTDKLVDMELSNLQYRAFGQTTSSEFSNNDVTECDADKSKDKGTNHKTLGIVLGAVFGGLALIILIIGNVMYCRKRKLHPYETI